jgi:hypothetical protein
MYVAVLEVRERNAEKDPTTCKMLEPSKSILKLADLIW